MIDVSMLSPRQLFELHSKIEYQLREKKIIRTANKPTGDLAEYLFCNAYPDWKRAGNSEIGIDATGPGGLRYQIKGRRITNSNKSRQMSAIQGLKQAYFDFLAGVLFNEDYSVKRAAIIPHAVLLNMSKERKHISFQKHTNSHRFLLVDDVLNAHDDGVTARLKNFWY